jgi:membrane-associated protease RseP (regulator of RpoE activity)
MIHETPAGRVVTLGLSRDGQPMAVKVQLADKHKEFAFMGPKPGDIHVQIPEIHIPDIDIPSMNMVVVTSSARSGLMVENITPQLGEFFGVKNGDGVLVRSVEKGSRAEKSGFRAGDVIVKVNGQQVHDTSDFAHAVHSRRGNAVSVAFVRDKKEQTLSLSLPQPKDSSDLIQEETFFDAPTIKAETALELSKMREYIALLRPEMEQATQSSRKVVQELGKSLCEQQRELQRQTERQRRELQRNMEHLRRELQRMRADWV